MLLNRAAAVGCRQLSKRERCGETAMTAASATANMKPIKTNLIRPGLLPSREGGATRTSCPTRRSAGANELVDTFVLPPPCLESGIAPSPSAAVDTCASQAACKRASGFSSSVAALMFWRPSALVGPFIFTGVSLSVLAGASPYKRASC